MACTITRRLLCRRTTHIYEHFYSVSYSCVSNDFVQTAPQKPLYYEGFLVQFVHPIYSIHCKHFSTSVLNRSIEKNTKEKCNVSKDMENEQDEVKKLTLFQKFKQMYRDYWYVLLPVHLVTSAGWFGSFYYMANSGVDIVALLETWHVSEKIINPLKDSCMGYVALAYAMYKVATPLRYTVTLGGTTISINYLKKWGYIKPVPSTRRMKEIYREKKENLIETIHEKKEEIIETKDQIIKTVSKGTEKLKKPQIGMKDKITGVKDKT